MLVRSHVIVVLNFLCNICWFDASWLFVVLNYILYPPGQPVWIPLLSFRDELRSVWHLITLDHCVLVNASDWARDSQLPSAWSVALHWGWNTFQKIRSSGRNPLIILREFAWSIILLEHLSITISWPASVSNLSAYLFTFCSVISFASALFLKNQSFLPYLKPLKSYTK